MLVFDTFSYLFSIICRIPLIQKWHECNQDFWRSPALQGKPEMPAIILCAEYTLLALHESMRTEQRAAVHMSSMAMATLTDRSYCQGLPHEYRAAIGALQPESPAALPPTQGVQASLQRCSHHRT